MSKKRHAQGADLSPVPVYERFSYTEKEKALEYIYKYSNTIKRAGRGDNHIYNNLLISADTETSKTGENVYRYTQKKKGGKVRKVQEYVPQENIVVAWTVSVRNLQGNICTVYGSKPSQFAIFLKNLQERLDGEKTLIYWYNLPFDWVMVQLFIYQELGYPVKQLNVKPHYPISIEFENGIIFRDALIIGQKSLGKWAEELQVEHQKETGKWNYDLIRKQDGNFTEDELLYIEHDTLALVECLDKLRISLNKHVYSLPYTCTGIIREECRNVGRVNRAKNRFLRIAPDFELYQKLERMFHGGYTHNNRNTAGWVYPTQEQKDKGYYPTCYDFCSSYPARMLYTKMPCERFRKLPDEHINRKEILKNADTTAYCFTFIAENAILKDMEEPMPVLQLSKCSYVKGEVCDNGRIIFAEKLCIEINELDLILIDRQYRFTSHDCVDVYASHKDYLPKWFRDLVFKCFKEKTMKKGGDAVDYSLAKARLNSLYGMTVQKSIKPEIVEHYREDIDPETNEVIPIGTFTENRQNKKELYETYYENKNSILPFYYGCWTTSASMIALYELADCLDKKDGVWLYSDTDSVYGVGWDEEKVKAYNEKQISLLIKAGYHGVEKDGKWYYPGVAEVDGVYKEFKGLHSKCYVVRKMDDSLKITIAGVPKKGVKCLNNDLSNFEDYFVFSGKDTGKMTHYYLYRDSVYIDESGIEYGNSIDLHECDYEISPPKIDDIEKILGQQDILIQVYEDE